MILKANTLVVSNDLSFTFEEMISLEIALINKGKLLPSQKLDYDTEGNIIVWYGPETDFTQEEEEVINTFLNLSQEEEEIHSLLLDPMITIQGNEAIEETFLDISDTQSIQSIPQNLMDTIMTGQEQASNATPV